MRLNYLVNNYLIERWASPENLKGHWLKHCIGIQSNLNYPINDLCIELENLLQTNSGTISISDLMSIQRDSYGDKKFFFVRKSDDSQTWRISKGGSGKYERFEPMPLALYETLSETLNTKIHTYSPGDDPNDDFVVFAPWIELREDEHINFTNTMSSCVGYGVNTTEVFLVKLDTVLTIAGEASKYISNATKGGKSVGYVCLVRSAYTHKCVSVFPTNGIKLADLETGFAKAQDSGEPFNLPDARVYTDTETAKSATDIRNVKNYVVGAICAVAPDHPDIYNQLQKLVDCGITDSLSINNVRDAIFTRNVIKPSSDEEIKQIESDRADELAVEHVESKSNLRKIWLGYRFKSGAFAGLGIDSFKVMLNRMKDTQTGPAVMLRFLSNALATDFRDTIDTLTVDTWQSVTTSSAGLWSGIYKHALSNLMKDNQSKMLINMLITNMVKYAVYRKCFIEIANNPRAAANAWRTIDTYDK